MKLHNTGKTAQFYSPWLDMNTQTRTVWTDGLHEYVKYEHKIIRIEVLRNHGFVVWVD